MALNKEFHLDIKEFENCINEAISEIPKHLREKIENLAFVVEDEFRPSSVNEKSIKFRGTTLGLYQGVPLPGRGPRYGSVLPDKITIFKNSIEELAGLNEKNIRGLIREVVHHEIGHYFGMNEPQVRAWEKRRRKFKN